MKSFTVTFFGPLCVIGLLALLSNGKSLTYNEDVDLRTEFSVWKKNYDKVYINNEEKEKRFMIWQENRKYINDHNAKFEAGLMTHSLELNWFGDISRSEFKKENSITRKQPRNRMITQVDLAELYVKAERRPIPKFMDWREHGVVNPVKDQKKCGSCYAFSTVGSIESHYAIKTGHLMSLSEQQIVDCAVEEGDDACNGGLMDYSFDYVLIRGITTEKQYPYKAKKGKCYDYMTSDVVWLHSYVDLPAKDEYAVELAVALLGPVSVAIDAENDFRFYKRGVFNSTICSLYRLDHAVLIVGYGTDVLTGRKYWLVRNSWGPNWGEKGYIRMDRDRVNMCGILEIPSFPRL